MQLESLCAREVIKDQFFSSDAFITNGSGTGPRLSDKGSAFRTVIFLWSGFGSAGKTAELYKFDGCPILNVKASSIKV